MKIICIGRNYREHILELNNQIPESPVFFMKPDTCLLQKNHPFYYPEFTQNLQYETEIVLKICKIGKHIQKEFAHTYFNEISVGIDFTARDLQENCKKKGLPWEISKAFDFSSPVGKFIDKKSIDNINEIDFHLEINGNTVQKGNSKDMIFDFETIISYVSQFVTLKIGDLIFTGTPSNVGKVNIGDNLKAFINNQCLLSINIK
jgi:2-keto-4-pentenoate hydratase/2-oxohepta-3-ene-1,7-dioic acid hydratase in catechol pathway